MLMATQSGKCMVPKDSLYFREQHNMVRTKITAWKSTGKWRWEKLTLKPPRKTLTTAQARKNAAKARQAGMKNMASTGDLKRPMRYRLGTSALREIRHFQKSTEAVDLKITLQLLGEGNCSGFQDRSEVPNWKR